ncbi:hypothetical protein ACLOJK_007065 [Asimina triloba]
MKAGSWEIVAAMAWIWAVDHAAVARTLLVVPSCSPPSATASQHRQHRQPATGPLMSWEIDTAVEDGFWIWVFFFRSALAVDAAAVEGSRRWVAVRLARPLRSSAREEDAAPPRSRQICRPSIRHGAIPPGSTMDADWLATGEGGFRPLGSAAPRRDAASQPRHAAQKLTAWERISPSSAPCRRCCHGFGEDDGAPNFGAPAVHE